MSKDGFRLSIGRAFQHGLKVGLTDWSGFANQSSLVVNKEFNKVSLRSGYSYEDIVKTALSLNHYNILLEDNSFFQFAQAGRGEGTVLRYAYYPNPFFLSDDELELLNESLIEAPELVDQVLDEADIYFEKPPIRYDFDPGCHSPCDHPAGHFHVGVHSGNRWPVKKILSPEAFFLFITKQYYPERWREASFENGCTGSYDNELDQKFSESLLGCPDVPDQYFTSLEERHLYLS